jgi:anti-sigma factor RsiW
MNTLDLIDSLAPFAHPRAELLHDFVVGDIGQDMAQAVRLHLSRCADCRELAEAFGWTDTAFASAKVISISDAVRSAASPAWRTPGEEELAAAHRIAGTARGSDTSQDGAPVVEHVPGATDGSAMLGYLCGGSNEVVVTDAPEGPARVVLGGNSYPLAAPDEWGIRVVTGMSRQDVTMWLARGGGRDGRFAVLHE